MPEVREMIIALGKDWESELKEMHNLPSEIRLLLKELISAHLRDYGFPQAHSKLVEIAKEHLGNGIRLEDGQLYSVMTYSEKTKRVFVLVPSFGPGTLKRLDEW
jgi:hypothetical protein